MARRRSGQGSDLNQKCAHRLGSYGYADFIPDDDDAAVERIKAADAIVIGKTQVPDFRYSGTGKTPLSVSASSRTTMFTRTPCARSSRARVCASASWATRPATSSTPDRSAYLSQPKSKASPSKAAFFRKSQLVILSGTSRSQA